MSAHGPDAGTHDKASNATLQPMKVGQGSMAFMFESCLMVGVTEWGLKTCRKVQEDYNAESWTPLPVHFKIPDGIKRVSNFAAGYQDSTAADIGKSVNDMESGEVDGNALPQYS